MSKANKEQLKQAIRDTKAKSPSKSTITERLTLVIALIFFIGAIIRNLYYQATSGFNFVNFLLEGIGGGLFSIVVVLGIAQVIHWVVKGKWMPLIILDKIYTTFLKILFLDPSPKKKSSNNIRKTSKKGNK